VLGKQPETPASVLLKVFALAGHWQIAPSPAASPTAAESIEVTASRGDVAASAPASRSQALGSQVQVNWFPGHWFGDEKQAPPLLWTGAHHPQPLIGVHSPHETNLRHGSPFGTESPRRRPSQPARMNSAAQAKNKLRMLQP
jgi:hypothetical protein